MYQFFWQISNFISEPLTNIGLNTKNIPLLSAFVLGSVGAIVPCQFTANLGAMTVYGNQSVQKGLAWKRVFFFTLGKIVVFSSLGLLVWMVGTEIRFMLTTYFPWIRRIVGPLLIIIGLFMIGVIRFTKIISLGSIPAKFQKKGNLGAFLMGVSFTLGFCPTMFSLFFILLMPMATSVSYGAVLPVIFALGTTMPLFIIISVIWYFNLGGVMIRKKGKKLGLIVQRLAGIFLILIGVIDTMTYWNIY